MERGIFITPNGHELTRDELLVTIEGDDGKLVDPETFRGVSDQQLAKMLNLDYEAGIVDNNQGQNGGFDPQGQDPSVINSNNRTMGRIDSLRSMWGGGVGGRSMGDMPYPFSYISGPIQEEMRKNGSTFEKKDYIMSPRIWAICGWALINTLADAGYLGVLFMTPFFYTPAVNIGGADVPPIPVPLFFPIAGSAIIRGGAGRALGELTEEFRSQRARSFFGILALVTMFNRATDQPNCSVIDTTLQIGHSALDRAGIVSQEYMKEAGQVVSFFVPDQLEQGVGNVMNNIPGRGKQQ